MRDVPLFGVRCSAPLWIRPAAVGLLMILAPACSPPSETSASETARAPAPMSFGFEGMARPEPEWQAQGGVTIEQGDAFQGSHSLRLFRAPEETHLPCRATGPSFPVAPGEWEIRAAAKADLVSPDNSFNGAITLECLDGAGKPVDRFVIGTLDGQKNWQPIRRKIELPEAAQAARFGVQLNKAHGSFLVDDLSASLAGARKSEKGDVDKILFSTAQMGNLLYPEDPRTVEIRIEAFRELAEEDRELTFLVLDYWGAEQIEPVRAALEDAGKDGGRVIYRATVDLTGAPLEVGRYYEMEASVPERNGRRFRNTSSFAILPEAAAKRHKPEEIPFTSRNWDNRLEEFYPLTDRLGIRICGIWGRWSPEPPYTAQAPRIDLCRKFGMGALTTTPIAYIEHRSKGHEKYDETCLREGARKLIETIGPVRPLIINLGNEPRDTPEDVRRNVEAYRIVYEEIKKIDPEIFVLSSSTNPQEEYFRQGFGRWCDAYDFHTYGDATSVRGLIRKYHRLFEKYGHAKPIWATELGLNSQGLERRVVAGELIRKVTTFFAAGGANVSWFGLLYPDPDLKLHGGSEDSHNVFDCRYKRYAPRLDAIAYYNMVNAIGIKKFAAETTYPEGIYAALFGDSEGQCLQVLWKDEGRRDVFVPLPEVAQVETIRIDGRRSRLDAEKRGITLTVDTDPVLLLYKQPQARLASRLEPPSAALAALSGQPMVRGTPSALAVHADQPGAVVPRLIAPPFWEVEEQTEANAVRYSLTPPDASRATEADVRVALRNPAGKMVGELYARPPVAGRLAVRVLPEPSAAGKPPGVALQLTNRGPSPIEVDWEISLVEALSLKDGKFGQPEAPGAAFAGKPAGSARLTAGKAASVVVPLSGADPFKLYRVHATASEGGHPPVTADRLVGGFMGVPRIPEPPQLDGMLDEAAWQNAPAAAIGHAHQFAPLRPATAAWSSPEDLAAQARFLWDDQYLYLGVEVTDDIAGSLKINDAIWAQDGLQFLIDPSRESARKPGKYDYAVALGAKGPQAWCYLTGDPVGAPVGEAKDIRVSARRLDATTGAMTYEIAIPWSRMAPFQPAPGANLGVTLIINEDDGAGRDSFMTWFGNAHTKQVDTAGDLILLE